MVDWLVLPRLLRYTFAGAYCYGTAVHVANISSWTGFDWCLAPAKWQVLDVIYLAVDLAVVVGLLAALPLAVLLLLLTATSQILLYTVFRGWVLDVPNEFALAPTDLVYLDGLIAFHIATIITIGANSFMARHRARLR